MPGPLELYEELKPRLGEKEARDLLEYVREAVEKGTATKEDIVRSEASTREEMQKLKAFVKEEIQHLEATVDRKIDTVKNELLREIASVKSELHKEMLGHLRWLFAFWITIIATVILKDLLR